MAATNERLPRLVALETYVTDVARAQTFWQEHFGLVSQQAETPEYQIGDVLWRLLPGAQPCHTGRPHGVLPAFQIEDFGAARGYLRACGIRVVFGEMIPGLNLLVFLDPDETPIALLQPTDPGVWDIAERRLLRTHQRHDADSGTALHLGPVAELTIYTHDLTASSRFYREIVDLPVGFAVFGHVHLVAENAPVVLRSVNWRCRAPGQPHATEPLFGVTDLAQLARRLQQAGYPAQFTAPGRLTTLDPVQWRVHFQAL